jgi:hypothetical protein
MEAVLLHADEKTDLELVAASLSFCEYAKKTLGSKGKIFLLDYSHGIIFLTETLPKNIFHGT